MGVTSRSPGHGGGGKYKKNDGNRSSITVLLLGDEGVGKSSLISTFVSRHFSEIVPGIMTRVRLPPDPNTSCITTIVDSQGGDAALLSAMAAMSLSASASTSGSSNSLASFSRTENLATAARGGRAGGMQLPSKMEGSGSGGGGQQLQHRALPSSGHSSGGVGMGSSAVSVSAGIDNVDSIVLVYDLDRVETFYRLENHWLPLIERCYNGEVPVIIAGNKMDLFRQSSSASSTDEQSLARSRQEIVSLLQRFKFVRQCIKCSAKNLLNVDEVFLKAQEAVLYPINPLYDLTSGRIAPDCRRAFTRIFRIYDKDNDGLLSNVELNRFQNQTFHVPLVERDLAGWKKVVSRNNPTEEAVVKDGKFTVSGFIAIFDVFISQNKLEVPWRVLRNFGYDDYLNLYVPSSVTSPPSGGDDKSNWRLSNSAREFLTAVFHQFDSDHDGILSEEDILTIFSIVPEPSLPPWHSFRAPDVFRGSFALPKVAKARSESVTPTSVSSHEGPSQTTPVSSPSLSASGITICSATSLPSVEMSTSAEDSTGTLRPSLKPLSFLEWMGYWHMISSISPSRTRAELYRLGHIEEESKRTLSDNIERKRGSKKKSTVYPAADYTSVLLPSKEIRVLVIGSKGCGKTSLVNALCYGEGVSESNILKTKPTLKPETSSSFVIMKKKETMKAGKGPGKFEENGEEFVVHLLLTEIPESEAHQHKSDLFSVFGHGNTIKKESCELVVFTFDCKDSSSLSYVKEIEKSFLTDEMPRVFVGTKSDTIKNGVGDSVSGGKQGGQDKDGTADEETTVHDATQHCADLDLEPPLLTSATKTLLGAEDGSASLDRSKTLQHFARCAFEDDEEGQLRAKPHAERKRRDAAKRRKIMWLGGLFSVSVAVAVGVGFFWGGKSGRRKDRLQWLTSWFIGGGSDTSAAPAQSA